MQAFCLKYSALLLQNVFSYCRMCSLTNINLKPYAGILP